MPHKLLTSIFVLVVIFACTKDATFEKKPIDVVLIGGGIMSATLGSLLKEFNSDLSLELYERLDDVALESSNAWNNAGTGHQSFCELNYTPLKDGKIDLAKAVEINEAFEISKLFWAYLVAKKRIENPQNFINRVPHMSFVVGDDNVAFLKQRYETMRAHPLFARMEYSEDHAKVKSWIPLMMEGRNPTQKIAATKIDDGVDVDFGALTRALVKNMASANNTKVFLSHEVTDLTRNADQTWDVSVRDRKTNKTFTTRAKFVFIGAGGAALSLLQKSNIAEGKGFGGFPVGGAWLITEKPELIERHFAKVYGKASIGAPPMSVPHLDTRYIDGKKAVLFGPFATYSTKFLKTGSLLDLPASVTLSNLMPMIQAGFHNLDLVKYLIGQLLMNDDEKLAALQEYFPNARLEDFRTEIAGQRVQIIKKDPQQGGILQFGTEIVSAQDGSVVALLGASPGASVAAKAMLNVVEQSFKDEMKTDAWQSKLKEMIPSYGKKLAEDPELLTLVHARTSKLLNLHE